VSEKELIINLKTGNQSAFEALYNKYSEKIFHVGLRFGLAKEDAMEIVQDVFVKVWERRMDIRTDLSFNAYLLTISKNFFIKKSRENATLTAQNQYYFKTHSELDTSSEDILIYSDLFNIAQSVIETLPDQQRQVFKLSRIDQLSNREISEKLNLSVRTVENHILRASARLKERLKELGIGICLVLGLL
jgi:RNA polymerase sigma-70 factor, ECF subfamily